MSDFDDEAEARAYALAVLERGTGPMDDDDDDAVFAGDDLDQVDHHLGAAGHSRSSLEGAVSLRDKKWDELNALAKFVRINPPSVLQGTLGGQQLVSVGTNKQVAMWGGDDSETLPVTVTFAPPNPFEQPSATPSEGVKRPYGIVRWGTRGFSATAFVDISRGVQFTVNASEVELQVGVETYTGAPASMLLGGMLSFWPTTHVAPITRSFYCDAFDPGAGFTIPVPNFARGVMLNTIPVADTTAHWELLFSNSQGTGVGGYSYPATAAGIPQQIQQFIPLSGQVAFVQVLSPGGSGDTLPFDLIFELAL